MYNTLGNFIANAKAGLIFVDFERHRTLQLIGRPEILWEEDGLGHETGGHKPGLGASRRPLAGNGRLPPITLVVSELLTL